MDTQTLITLIGLGASILILMFITSFIFLIVICYRIGKIIKILSPEKETKEDISEELAQIEELKRRIEEKTQRT